MDEFLPQESAIPAMKARKAVPVDSQAGTGETSPAARSFEELFLEHWNAIYRLLARMTGDPAEAEDLALETFYRFYQRPPKPGEGYNPGGWLYRVATHLGLHAIRSTKRREHYEMTSGKGALQEDPRDRPAELLESKEEQRLARATLARMNPRHARLLILRYSGLAYKDIAKALRLSPTSIGPLLVRAEGEFEKVYRALTEEEV
jgi:RNA polymerase sigma factor (sigma-70 family)